MRIATVNRVRSSGFFVLLLSVLVAVSGCATATGAGVGALIGGIACGGPCAKLGAFAGGAAGLLVDASRSSSADTHYDSLGRPVYTYAPGFGGAAQLDVVNDLPIADVTLDVRVNGRLQASDIQFGENRLIGLEPFGIVPGKRYIVYIVGRQVGMNQIVGSRVFCVSPGYYEPVRETILLHVGRLNLPGRGGESCH